MYVRILIDGFSLLHAWPELAPGRPRHSVGAREELITILTQYQDATGTPVTVFFDGAGRPAGLPREASTHSIEVIYSSAPKSADDLIERVAHRLAPFGPVLVVTNDFAERDTVSNFGATPMSCEMFRVMVADADADLTNRTKRLHDTARKGFRRSPR